jgi:hypothetical protein
MSSGNFCQLVCCGAVVGYEAEVLFGILPSVLS